MQGPLSSAAESGKTLLKSAPVREGLIESMKYIVTAAQMKKAEQNADRKGITFSALMDNAGAACYRQLVHIFGDVKDKLSSSCAGAETTAVTGLSSRIKSAKTAEWCSAFS